VLMLFIHSPFMENCAPLQFMTGRDEGWYDFDC